jgi:hypothetical protein
VRDASVLLMSYSISINSHVSTHRQHHCHSLSYCFFCVILITTAANSLSGTVPEIGQLTKLTYLYLGKYDGCFRSSHVLFCIYDAYVLFMPCSFSTLTTGFAVSSIYLLEQRATN